MSTYPPSVITNDEEFYALQKLACEKSLAVFTKCAWPIIEPSVPLQWNWHLDTVCAYLMAFINNELPNKRLIINIPPGSMKSSVVSVTLTAWLWCKNPGLRILCVTNESGLAVRDALKMKQIITSEWYQKHWPIKLKSDQNEKTLFNVETHGGFRQSLGISGQITGKRGDLVLVDDPIDARMAYSDVVRKGVNDTFNTTLTTRVNDPEKSGFIVIMQRVHDEDLCGMLKRKAETHWTTLSIPMEYEEAPTFDAGRDIGKPEFNDPRTKKGELLFPDRFSSTYIKSLQEDLGVFAYAAQYQQRPSPEGGGVLKAHYWKIWDTDKPLPYMSHVFLSIDTAYDANALKNNAFSAITRWGIWFSDEKDRWLIMCLGMFFDRLGYDDLRSKIKEEVTKHDVDVVLIERKATGISLYNDLRKAIPGKVRGYIPKEDKLSRAYSVSPLLQAGLCYIPAKEWAIGNGKDKVGLIEYLASFPAGAPPSADLCLIAGTRIATKRGSVPIEQITLDDLVLTPSGWQKVLACGFTGVSEVVERFGLVGTKTHPVYSRAYKKYVNLDTMTQANELIRLNVCGLLLKVSHELFSTKDEDLQGLLKKANITLVGGIGNPLPRACTLLFGKTTTAQKCQRAMKLTTLMAIRSIIALKTLSVYQKERIVVCLKELTAKKRVNILRRLGRLQLSGTGLKPEGNGIDKMQKLAFAGQMSWQSSKPNDQGLKAFQPVFGAARNLNIKATAENFVALNAKCRKAGSGEENISSSTPIMRPVYNLTVENDHCYFANGILVHNCDTTTQALIHLRSGNWIGDHPDDKEEPYDNTDRRTDEEREDQGSVRRTAAYG